jgi:peptide deformylase
MSALKIIEILPTEIDRRDTVLRQKADEISDFGTKTQAIISDLVQTFEAHSIAVGLAAPQLGICRRITVINISKGKADPHTVLINPMITESSAETDLGYESCMSIPNYKGKVERARKVCVSYYDKNGMGQKIMAEGFHARVLQHEIDHLDGILYPDRMAGVELETTDIFLRDKTPSEKQ